MMAFNLQLSPVFRLRSLLEPIPEIVRLAGALRDRKYLLQTACLAAEKSMGRVRTTGLLTWADRRNGANRSDRDNH
jgi:hypothetical protein